MTDSAKEVLRSIGGRWHAPAVVALVLIPISFCRDRLFHSRSLIAMQREEALLLPLGAPPFAMCPAAAHAGGDNVAGGTRVAA